MPFAVVTFTKSLARSHSLECVRRRVTGHEETKREVGQRREEENPLTPLARTTTIIPHAFVFGGCFGRLFGTQPTSREIGPSEAAVGSVGGAGGIPPCEENSANSFPYVFPQ